MKVGIIGAGFAGLTAAYRLVRNGEGVTLFEAGSVAGGLASGFNIKGWDWDLEKHYHHFFRSDRSVTGLADAVGHKVIFTRPKTSVYLHNQILQLDSPLSLLKFPYLPFVDRLRTGIILSYLKLTPFWKPLEGFVAEEFLGKTMGQKAWNILWQPLFEGKFGNDSPTIPASWFWARIKKRSAMLGYPYGGFSSLVGSICKNIKKMNGKIIYNSSVESIFKKGNTFHLVLGSGRVYEFDRIICTLPMQVFLKIAKDLPKNYIETFKPLKSLAALTLILRMKNKFLEDGTYWLNINDVSFPFLAVVEHTNFISRKHYGGDRILYIGNYLPQDNILLSMTKEKLIKHYLPYLQSINKNFSEASIISSLSFKDDFAQPIIPLNYSKEIPSMITPINGLYLANMQQVYPWDRGTNYAVELGNKAAKMVIKSK
jgi:protoporphyrinogen oxidase